MSINLLGKICFRMRRACNQSHRYDFTVSDELALTVTGPIALEPFDGTVFDPCIVRRGTGLAIVYSDRVHGSLVEARSSDGVVWGDFSTLLKGGTDPCSWDNVVNRGCLSERCGRRYLWFTGQNDRSSSIGLAIDDGCGFRRAKEAPVLSSSDTSYDAFMNPCVLWDETSSRWRMWLSAGEQYEPDVILHAWSDDGLHWNLDNAPVFSKNREGCDSCKVGACDIVQVPWRPGYFMFYIGYQNIDVSRICAAWSPDGISSWRRFALNPIVAPERGSWARDSVYKPAVYVPQDPEGETWIWFNGRRAGEEKIGRAVIRNTRQLFDLRYYR